MATENYTPDRLLANDDLITDYGTIIMGQVLLRGTILGQVAASGKYKKVDSTATDGSNFPVAILVKDTDTTAADLVAAIYLAGEFNANAVILGGTDTVATAPLSVGAIPWAGTIAKLVGATVVPTVANGYVYRCMTAGTTAGSAPTWPQVEGGAVLDGTVVWRAFQIKSHQQLLRILQIILKTPLKA